MSLIASIFLASTALASLQQALNSSAEWTMERQLKGSDRVLRSSGTVACQAGVGIAWRVESPFASSVTMTTNSMVFVDEEGERVKSLAELPHYERIREATDAFVAGETESLAALFEVEEETLEKDGWRLKLTPKSSAMRRLVSAVELMGAALPTNAVLTTGDGGRAVIRFKERARVN